MIKNNKGKLILSSVIILLPMIAGLLLWDRLPETLATHWGMDGQPDGWSSAPMSVFLSPVILLGAHWLCVLITVKEGSNQDRNRKPLGLMLWIIPVISNLSAAMTFSLALGAEFSVSTVMLLVIGLMFVIIGNYLPKCRYNFTLGIKLPWTFSSEENWNATHRFGGRVWMIGGVAIALCAFLPGEWGISLMLAALLVLIVVPTVYSYRFYKKQRQEGLPPVTANPMTKWSLLVVAAFLVFLFFMAFTGDIQVNYRDSYLYIESNRWDGLTVAYDAIDSIEYRDNMVSGSRTNGFGGLRVLLGTFENEEFGYYVRYTYTGCDACVVVDVGGQILVLSGADADATRAIYEELVQRTQD